MVMVMVGYGRVQNMMAWRCMVLGSANTGFGGAEILIKYQFLLAFALGSYNFDVLLN